MLNEKIKNIAEKIRQLSNIPEEEKFGSVIAILMIVSICITLVRVIQECNKNKLNHNSTLENKCLIFGNEIRSYSIKKSWWTKLRVKRIIKRNMSKDQYVKYNQNLTEAIFSCGQKLKDEEVSALLEAAFV